MRKQETRRAEAMRAGVDTREIVQDGKIDLPQASTMVARCPMNPMLTCKKSLSLCASWVLCLWFSGLVSAQTSPAPPVQTQHAGSAQLPGLYNPIGDPAAVVTVGSARFTVLTAQLIRMEWAADGKFEDHP